MGIITVANTMVRSIRDALEQASPVQTMGYIEALKTPTPRALVTDLIPMGKIVLVEGRNHCGKTWFANSLAFSVATGEPFLGKYEIPEVGNVLYIEQDSGADDVVKGQLEPMLKLYTEKYPLVNAEENYDEYHPLKRLFFLFHKGVNLMDAAHVAHVIKTANSLYSEDYPQKHGGILHQTEYDAEGNVIIDEDFEVPISWDAPEYHGARLIIFDTFRALNNGDENSSNEMQQVMDALKEVRRLTGATIVVLLHTAAVDGRERGSTAIGDASDQIFHLKKKIRSPLVSVYKEKARYYDPKSFIFRISTDEHPDLGTIKSVTWHGFLEDQEDREEDTVNGATSRVDRWTFYDHLFREGPESRQASLEWAGLNQVPQSTLRNWVARLKKDGQITVTDGPEGTVIYEAMQRTQPNAGQPVMDVKKT